MAKEKKGLGAGLDVLFGTDDFESDISSDLQTLPISKVEPRAGQPRVRFDDAALQALSESIAQYGLIQPITVRALPSGYYQIIAGERRWRACRLAGLEEIPVRIIEADDRRTAELALVENLQREDLNPIEEAMGYKTLIEEYGLTQEDAAKSVGRSRPAITNALRLLSLTPEVLGLVEKGQLSAGHARALVSVSDAAKQLTAAKEVISKNYSVRKTEQLAAKISKQPTVTSTITGSVHIDYCAEVSDELSRVLGRRVTLTDGKRSGKIELEFYGDEDREALIKNLHILADNWIK